MPRPSIASGALALRAVAPVDIEPIRQWRNAQMDVLRQSAPITPAAQEAYFAAHVWPAQEQARPANILLTFTRDGRPIGYGGMVHIAWEHARAEASFLLAPDLVADRDSYAAHFAAFLALLQEFAFADLGFNRLWTETYAFRDHHIAVLERAGFAREGVMCEHVVIDGRPVDSLIHGCLAAGRRD